ncbi:hypothetical protein [Sphingopyxis sp. 113P3]|uniref:hypothetical protein n=1 Tax=Sphingopyxis sp. (strain 113P3) TaxID=292913 RepID=UPI0006AD3BDE|nr:hypothetical protein [Sphingopyxis sp. 113P3]ALC13791.1 hypothetical protein LH20_17675 [Sphingopyxis sp. 113P3]
MGKHTIIAPVMPRLVDEETAAAYLGRGRTKFREEVAKRLLPAHSDQNGNVKLWDIRLLDHYIDGRSGFGDTSSGWDR